MSEKTYIIQSVHVETSDCTVSKYTFYRMFCIGKNVLHKGLIFTEMADDRMLLSTGNNQKPYLLPQN